MTSSLRVPTYLQASTDAGGPARVAWLAALPARVDELSARWQLILDEPFEPGGNCAWVAPGVDVDGRDVVLKVAWQHTESLHEAEGLAALGGEGAAEVYAFDHLADDTTAMLLERCRPGTELRGRPETEQHVVVTELLRVGVGRRPAGRPSVPSAVGDGRRLGGESRSAARRPTRNSSTRGWLARGSRCSASSREPDPPRSCSSPTSTPATCCPASAARGY